MSGGGGERLGNRLAPPRFLLFLALLPAAYFVYTGLTETNDWKDGAAMAFDVAASCFLLSLIPLLRDAKTDDIRRHARDNDANRFLVLIITSLLTLVAMTSIGGELARVNAGDWLAAVKLVATLLLVWLFANAVYTLHYAHVFYGADPQGADRGGLDFPGTRTPGYPDFAYFAFTLGMTFQTSDVGITAPTIRKVALLHSFAAFVFNIGVIAFTINVLGGGR